MNDIFTILNSIPANVLLTYGLYYKGLVPSLCFGAVWTAPYLVFYIFMNSILENGAIMLRILS
jgi:hypothetical protein